MYSPIRDFSYRKELRTNLKISLPLLGSYFLQAASGFISIIFLARLGTSTLAAAGLVSVIFYSFIAFYWGVFSAIGVLVAQYHGAKNNFSINLTLTQGFLLAIALAIPSWSAVYLIGKLLYLSHQPPAVLLLALKYLHATAWSLFPLALLFVFEEFLIGLSKTRLVLIIKILQIPCEVLLYYVLIYGKFGFPKLGIAGIGVAFTIVFSLAAILVAGYIFFAKSLKPYTRHKDAYLFRKDCFLEILNVGLPIGLMVSIELLMLVGLAFFMGHISSNALAAYQITLQYTDLTLMITYGFSQATMVRVGNMIGENNKPNVLKVSIISTFLCCLLTLFICTAYLLFPHFFIGIDINPGKIDQGMIKEALTLFPLMVIFLLIESYRTNLFSMLRAIKDTATPMLISLLCFWGIALSSAYMLAFHTDISSKGVWWGASLASFVAAILLTWRFLYLYQRLNCKAVLNQFSN